MTRRKLLSFVLAAVMLLSTMSFSVYAEKDETTTNEEIVILNDEPTTETEKAQPVYVATVGTESFTDISEAVSAWTSTNNSTLTLLSDVTLSSKISLLSTDCHTLNLGTYTMTAAKSQPAIEITSNMQTTAADCLIIKADEVNPGGITGSYAVRCYTVDGDRPMIKIYGGIFNGSISIAKKPGTSGSTPNDAYLYIYGGEFLKSVSANRAKTFISGGVFHQAINFSVDTTAYLLIKGGKFYSPNNQASSALTNGKWVFGTELKKHDVDIYVDNDGYYVVTDENPEKPGTFEASVFYDTDNYVANATTKGIEDRNGQFVFSKVGDEKAIYYTSADVAVRKNTKGVVTLYDGTSESVKTSGNLEINMSASGADFTGNVTLGGKTHTFTVVYDSSNPYEGTVTPTKGYALQVTETKGTIVTRTYSNTEAYARIGDTNYASLEEAMNNVADGETITLLKDIELSKAIGFTKDIEFTIDGNNHKITPAADSTEANSAFHFGQGDDSTRAARKYDLKNIIFEGWTTDHVVRLQGTTSVVENCTFINNEQPDGLGVLTVTFADATIKNCTFKNNNGVKVIDFNSWGDGSQSVNVVEGCTFENNVCSGPGVIYHNDGASVKVKDSFFIGNTVNTNGNAAVAYMGWGDGAEVSECLFKDNTVTTAHATTIRFASAIFCDGCEVKENAFVNNKAIRNGEEISTSVAVGAYYGAADVSDNYWGNETEPVKGEDYTHEYPDENSVTNGGYYTIIEYTEDDFILSGHKDIVTDIAVGFELAPAKYQKEDEKVYNINLTADGKIINRLNSVDLTFVLNQIEGNNDFEIITSNDEVAINAVDNSKVRYEFHYNGKTDVNTDTSATITIGQVKFTGYGKFSFAVATEDANGEKIITNAVHATKNDNNIVDTFVPGGNIEEGEGKLNIEAKIDGAEIKVPVRTLTVNVTFPNAVVDQNAEAYQDMKVAITGTFNNDVTETREYKLGEGEWKMNDNGTYVVTEANLVLNNAYTVTVSGAGYRTARYTVTMTDHKAITFWNNVMDNNKAIEEGKKSSETKLNFLAGDIVKDNNINIYDLSAVVSYFSTQTIDDEGNILEADYAKYDLNRDGVIDSKDVAYVLVSWGN